MSSRLTKLGAALAALAALAIGGSALASAAGGGSQPAPGPTAKSSVAKPDAAVSEPAAAADTDSIQDENGKDDASEPAGAAENETGEAPATAGEAESGSETPGDDGPGGWADEPGNPNADTQQEGQH